MRQRPRRTARSPERRRETTGPRPAAPPGHEWLYGRNAVRESLRAGRRRHRRLLVAEGIDLSGGAAEAVGRAEELGVPVETAERQALDEFTSGANHQGLCLLASEYPYESLAGVLRENGAGLYLVLDSLQDPQNIGTLLRTAEALAVDGVVLPERRAAGITPAVVNASAGAVEHLGVAQVTNVARALEQLQRVGIWTVALEPGADSRPLWELDLIGALALVVGSEGEGIRRLVRERCDSAAYIPQAGSVESLNAAVAGSIALYEVLRQRSIRRNSA